MCWNAEASITSFGIIGAVSYLLWRRNNANDRLIGLFVFSYGLMQLFETLMWWGQSKESEDLNRIGSVGASVLLYTHPLAFLTGMAYDKGYKGISSSTTYQLVLSLALGFLAYGSWQTASDYFTGARTFLSYPDPVNGHLVWEFPDSYELGMAIIFLIGILFIIPKYPKLSILLAAYFLIPIITMKFTVQVSKENTEKNYLGSYWCWWVATFSFVLYGINA